MATERLNSQRYRGIAFVGTYLPRACGIASFTHDLATAVAGQAGEDQPVIVAAMNDVKDGYVYPDRVKFELRQDYPLDYSRAADFLNFSHIDIVNLQHEYGIYGGEHGSDVLRLLNDLNRPAVVTCHTIFKHPESPQKEIMQEIAVRAERLVVMSHRATHFLENAYGISKNKIVYIPHGIHDAPFIDPNYYKDKFGVEGRRVLLTFGLLRRDKGIEYMIEALPKIVERHPKTSYVVLGATHPALVRKEGESYRLSLQRRIRQLGLEQHVLFYPRFVELDELLQYLGAADIFISPYLHMEQITSGALAYAMGTGKAVVSTPYWHAEELLEDGKGILVPPKNPDALADAIVGLLDDEVKLTSVRKRAYSHCRPMTWASVARQYINIFDEIRQRVPIHFPIVSAMRSPIAATNSPAPKIDHLLRLSDDTGPCKYANFSIPDWKWGYALEDATATFVAAASYNNTYKDSRALRLSEICLSFLQTVVSDHHISQIPAGLDYTRQKTGTASQDVLGKTIWALGYGVWRSPKYLSVCANDLFQHLLPPMQMECPRAAAYGILGGCNYLQRFPGATGVKRFVNAHVEVLEQFLRTTDWFNQWPATDWPIPIQALYTAFQLLNDQKHLTLANEQIQHLCDITSNGTVFHVHHKNSVAEESPVTCASFIETLGAAYAVSPDLEFLNIIRSAVDWFLGANQRNESLYDFSTGGCRDALTATSVNENQGTEATAYCLLAFLSLNKIVAAQELLGNKEQVVS